MAGSRRGERGGAPPSRRKQGPVLSSRRVEGGRSDTGRRYRWGADKGAAPCARAKHRVSVTTDARGPRDPPTAAARARGRLATAARDDSRRSARAAAPVRASRGCRQTTAARSERGVPPCDTARCAATPPRARTLPPRTGPVWRSRVDGGLAAGRQRRGRHRLRVDLCWRGRVSATTVAEGHRWTVGRRLRSSALAASAGAEGGCLAWSGEQ